MSQSDDVGEVAKYLFTLVEDPRKLAEYKQDPAAAVKAANLSPGSVDMLLKRVGKVEGSNVIIVVIVVVVV